jgi:hypothetical protein
MGSATPTAFAADVPVVFAADALEAFAAHAPVVFASDVGPEWGLGPAVCLRPEGKNGGSGDLGASGTSGVHRGCLSSVRIASSENIVLSTCENNLSGYC